MSVRLSVLDLFAGAGGLSLGFKQAGFTIDVAIELDDWAATTFERNFNTTQVIRANIQDLSDEYFRSFSGIDTIIGGPPCQGFSISASNRRSVNDPRNILYRNFLRVVSVIKPALVLIENVKEFSSVKNEHGESILKEVVDRLSNMNYLVTYGLLKAIHFGVPQDRIRFFLMASKYQKPSLPTRTHGPIGDLFDRGEVRNLWDAISDLPEVVPRLYKEDAVLEYSVAPLNQYQAQLRNGSAKIYNHIPMRHTDRIIERFSKIMIASREARLPDHLKPYSKEDPKRVSNKIYDQNHRRLDPFKPCSTITASFYSSFIHPFQHRNLTVREAARVQSFPDSFIFYGKRTRLSHKLLKRKGIVEDIHLDQFNQVGNAVPPLLAKSLAESLQETVHRV